MKKVFLTALMLAISLTGTAQNGNEKKGSIVENGDTKVFISPEKVTVKKENGTTTINITGENDGAEYTYYITSTEDDSNTKTVYKETDSSWDFTIPFVTRKKSSLSTQQRGRLIIDPTFGFGVIGATGQGEGVDLSFGNGSFEYILDRIVGLEYMTTRNSYVGLTFGLDWRNYKMIGNNRWVKDGDKTFITNYPDGTDVNYSRLRTLSLTLSFMYGYKFNRYVSMQVGPVKENFGCERCNNASLKDRTGASFPLMYEFGHRNLVLNSQITYMCDKRDELSGAGILHHHFIFTKENGREISSVLEKYRRCEACLGMQIRRMGIRQK